MHSAALKENMNNIDRVMLPLQFMIRAIDLHSRFLMKEIETTTPQLLALQEVGKYRGVTPTRIALYINLSKATVSGIIDRLREKGCIICAKNNADWRKFSLRLTHDSWDILKKILCPLNNNLFINLICCMMQKDEYAGSNSIADVLKRALRQTMI